MTNKTIKINDIPVVIDSLYVEILNDEGLVIFLPTDYIKNSVECHITNGIPDVDVKDIQQMLKYYKSRIEALEDDSEFNCMIDSITSEAYSDGELWLDEIDGDNDD